MSDIIWNFVAFVIALSILVAIHEFGHFWVARRCGVHVERFSIGFGKTLWSTQDFKGTQYIIALIPLGGYLKMLNERTELVPFELKNQAFNNKTILQRTAIIGAGPLANLIFALMACWLVFIIGIPDTRPLIIDVIPKSIAEKSGIAAGMEFKSIDGVETSTWSSARQELLKKIGQQQVAVELLLIKSGKVEKKILDLKNWGLNIYNQDLLFSLGITPCCYKFTPILSHIESSSPAEKAGLQVGDKIVKVNDQLLDSWPSFVSLIRKNPNQSLILDIERQGTLITLSLKLGAKWVNVGSAEHKIQVGFAGIVPRMIPIEEVEKYKVTCQYNIFSAFSQAGQKVWQMISLTTSLLKKLILGEISLNYLGGPVSIARDAGASAHVGFVYYLVFLALISINLAMINLLPLPVLDGGHLLFLLIEKCKKRPISEKAQNFSYRVGLIFLLLLMGVALYNDFSRF